ncbi:hypothetical protein B0H17DRAFT_1134367 [Mycena rosella]|uniref:Uncharacterized protein n=1 Tax=Mycena rosella TaxID=1033263 RepID=A0AAD7DFS1_MYCRO|nr:hypothetical protein B0H17DRAFT_1134367 [Mycena rosella]
MSVPKANEAAWRLTLQAKTPDIAQVSRYMSMWNRNENGRSTRDLTYGQGARPSNRAAWSKIPSSIRIRPSESILSDWRDWYTSRRVGGGYDLLRRRNGEFCGRWWHARATDRRDLTHGGGEAADSGRTPKAGGPKLRHEANKPRLLSPSQILKFKLLTMPSESWRDEAVRHVEAMAKYMFAHAISSVVLSQDHTQTRYSLAQQVRESKEPHLRHELKEDPSQDATALLRGWNEALANQACATTFIDHILSPAIRNHGSRFFKFYQETLKVAFDSFMSHLLQHPPVNLNGDVYLNGNPPAPSAGLANVDLDCAKALLSAPDGLLGMRLYHRDGNEAVAGFWHVASITRKTACEGLSVTFEVVFNDEHGNQTFEAGEKDILDLLLHSCVVPRLFCDSGQENDHMP